MHLDECFELAFSRSVPINDDESSLDQENKNDNYYYLPFFNNDNTSAAMIQPKTNYHDDSQNNNFVVQKSGSIFSMVHCILTAWGTKSQTGFYIPPEYYAGYSYLFEQGVNQPVVGSLYHDDDRFGAHFVHQSTIQQQQQYYHEHNRNHHHPAFVYAENIPNNLHSHHYDVYYMHGNLTQASMDSPRHVLDQHPTNYNTTSVMTSSVPNGIKSSNPITIPYVHPELQLPVPPLNLPIYFGILCWSYAIAGILILYLPPKWCEFGGGKRDEEGNGEGYVRRHWFPLKLYGTLLIVGQSPCSFLADYVHMTNISAWHTIDRFLACNMMCLELGKLITMRTYTRPIIYIFNLAFCCIAVLSFLQSQKAQQALDENGFIFWHCAWHCYPIAACIIHLIEHYMNQKWGEYYPFDDGCDALDMQEKRRESSGTTFKKSGRGMAFTTNASKPGLRRSRRIAGQAPSL